MLASFLRLSRLQIIVLIGIGVLIAGGFAAQRYSLEIGRFFAGEKSCGQLSSEQGYPDACCADVAANAAYCVSQGFTVNLGPTTPADSCAVGCFVKPKPAPPPPGQPPPPPPAGGFDGFCNYPADLNRPECACSYPGNRQNQCHVCTDSWQTGYTAYSDAQWAAWNPRCDASCPDSGNPYRTSKTQIDGPTWSGFQTCVEKPDDCPNGWYAYGLTGCKYSGAIPPPPPPGPPPPPARTYSCLYPGDLTNPQCACTYGNNRKNQCHVCTPSWREGNTDYSDAQWLAWDDEGSCDATCPNPKFPYRTGKTQLDGPANWDGQSTCVEKPDDCPDKFYAFGLTGCKYSGVPPPPPPPPVPPRTYSCLYPGDLNNPVCACGYGNNRQNQCHVCTPSWREGNTDYSNAQWLAWDDEGSCDARCPNSKFPYRTGKTQLDGPAWSGFLTCVEKPDDCPDGWYAYGLTGCKYSGVVAPPAPPAQPPPPAPTPTPSPPVLQIDGKFSSTRRQFETFTFTGTRITPSGYVTRFLRFPNAAEPVALSPNLQASSNGTVSWTFTAGCSSPLGIYTVQLVDQRTGLRSNTVTETVTQHPDCATQAPPPPPPSGQAPLPMSTVTPTQFNLNEGDLISALFSSDPDVFIVNAKGYKRLFLNEVIFNYYGHLGGFQNVKVVSPATRDAFVTSNFFKKCETPDGKVYALEVTAADAGRLHEVQIPQNTALASDPGWLDRQFCINDREFNWYPKGTPYTSLSQIPRY